MKSNLQQGLAVPIIICAQLIRWSTISLLTASGLSIFGVVSGAEAALGQGATSSDSPSIKTPGNLINRPTLKLGSQGRDVSELQATLRLLGFYAGMVDGSYGESTAIAVSRFQAAAELPADGIVGAATWNQLFPLSASEVAASAIKPATPTLSASTPPAAIAPATAFPVPSTASSGNTLPNRSPALATTPATAVRASSSTVELPILRMGMQGSAVMRLQERLRAAGFFQGVVDGAFGLETQVAVEAAQRQYQLEIDGIVGPATWSALLR